MESDTSNSDIVGYVVASEMLGAYLDSPGLCATWDQVQATFQKTLALEGRYAGGAVQAGPLFTAMCLVVGVNPLPGAQDMGELSNPDALLQAYCTWQGVSDPQTSDDRVVVWYHLLERDVRRARQREAARDH